MQTILTVLAILVVYSLISGYLRDVRPKQLLQRYKEQSELLEAQRYAYLVQQSSVRSERVWEQRYRSVFGEEPRFSRASVLRSLDDWTEKELDNRLPQFWGKHNDKY